MPPMAEMSPMEALTGDWPALQTKWEAWADSLADRDLERIVNYKMLDGTAGGDARIAGGAAPGEPRDAASRPGGGRCCASWASSRRRRI